MPIYGSVEIAGGSYGRGAQYGVGYALVDTPDVQSEASVSLSPLQRNLTLLGAANIDGIGNAGANEIVGNDGSNGLSGLGGNDILFGGAGNDWLSGDSGDDLILGGVGADVMNGGTGDDGYLVDDADDVVVEASSGGTDLVVTSVTWILPDSVENLALADEGGSMGGGGNAGANVIVGNDALNVLLGFEGNDTLRGGGGDDLLDGGTGSDRMEGGAGDDTFVVDGFGDSVIESASGGYDTVLSSESYFFRRRRGGPEPRGIKRHKRLGRLPRQLHARQRRQQHPGRRPWA